MNNKILIIIGAAPCVIEDTNEIQKITGVSFFSGEQKEFDFMAIGLDAITIETLHLKYFATYHPSEIEEARQRRINIRTNTDYMVISHISEEVDGLGNIIKYDVNLIIPIESPSGSSALLGVLAGIKLGYEKIIVCGCPLTGINDKGYDYANFRVGWTAKLSEIKDKTRSMSGWTKELLGIPTSEWLND